MPHWVKSLSTPAESGGFHLRVRSSTWNSGAASDPLAARHGGAGRSPPPHPLELGLVAVVGAHLCFLPWALGGMHAWAQLSSLGLSIAGLALALAGRPERSSAAATAHPARDSYGLLQFPIFWAGLALVAYEAIQGLNPAWRYTSDASSWWLVPLTHAPWLPSGIDGPFLRSNAWRSLTIDASLWLTTCSVWVGFRRRQSYRILFTVLVANGSLLALLGILQQLASAKKIFWSYLPANDSFIASFVYRNHAGCYFNLLTSLAAGMAWWHFDRERRRLERTGRAAVFTFMAVFMGIMALFSYSRMAEVLLLLFTAIVAAVLTSRLVRRREGAVTGTHLLPTAIAVAAFLIIGVVTLRSDKMWGRFSGLVHDPIASVSDRAEVRRASEEMLGDHWLLGWGAGAFRYAFPLYAQKFPAIYFSSQGQVRYWEHAHDDLLEFTIELGAIGCLPLLFMLGYFAVQLLRRNFWGNGLSLCAVLGCALVLLHAWVDFVFQNPAVLLTWGVMLTGALRWAELDSLPGRRLVLANAPIDIAVATKPLQGESGL
jgi:O-Antigen ligase